jgi:NitT/TauT family transport system permease protein
MKKLLPPVLFLIVFFAGVELITAVNLVPPYLLPPPSVLFKTLSESHMDLLMAFISSFGCALVGFTLSSVVGLLLSIVFASSVFLTLAFKPFIAFFQTVPIVAIAPLMVVWFGFGSPTTIAAALIVSFFPVLANTTAGFINTPVQLLELFKIYDASKLKTLVYLKIPACMPFYFAGLRVAAGLSVVGTLVGEFVGGGGLGAMIDASMTQQRADLVFLCAILSSMMGLLMIFLVNVAEKILNKWRPLQ